MLEKSYDARETEKRIQEFWESEGIYRFDAGRGGEVYSIDTPPPTVSGSLHIGHIFSYTQAEMIARFQRMQGKNIFYPFGFDDNGLPTERLVERELGAAVRTLERAEFTRSCTETAAKYVEEFRELWKSLGFCTDWSLQYETISPAAVKISQKAFLELVRSGRAYRKEAPVLWCTNCRTSIAQAELESVEKETSFNRLLFTLDAQKLPVATTRPELLYGCTALFIHPGDERYKGMSGKLALVPLYNYEIPVLEDEKVDMQKGTGVVMCATFGDVADLEWYNTHRLPYKRVIEAAGRLAENVPYVGGLPVREARAKILQLLEEKGLLDGSDRITHTVGVHERCGNEIEILPSKQWFVELLSRKTDFLEAADKINWYPGFMKSRYLSWVESLKWDWCVSRQRFFGVPIPLWYCRSCGAVIPADDKSLPADPRKAMPKKPCSCGSTDFEPEEAVLDTWATSSLTPLINARWGEAGDMSRKLLPMSMRTQAHEIIRTWAFYTIVRSLYHTAQLPWRDIMICGFVLAKKGEKISKSKSNADEAPRELIGRYSADAVRYWSASARLGSDTMFEERELQGSRRFLTKLWNAARFTEMHLQDYNGKKPALLLPVDAWILERTGEVRSRVTELLERYETGLARHEADELFWRDCCDSYIELVKDRLYKPEAYGADARLSGQYALCGSFLAILELYAIYIPHMTEEIYQACFRQRERDRSIHCRVWSKGGRPDQGLLALGDALKAILGEVRKYKSERSLSVKAPVKRLLIQSPPGLLKLLEGSSPDIAACTGAECVGLEEGGALRVIIPRN